MAPLDPSVADAISKLGAAAVLVLVVLLFLRGDIRVGKLVDAERARDEAERDKREVALVAERDAWRDRSLATEDRLGRFANVLERITKSPAPE